MQFVKMHGLGNDYIYINGFEEKIENPNELSRRISDRHFGIGSDGLIIIEASEIADFKMRMYNSDGSEGKMCGNGIRCVAKYVYEMGLTQKTFLNIETGAGIKRLWLQANGGRVQSVQVDMGEPEFDPINIPTTLEQSNLVNYPLKAISGTYNVNVLSMGNPHCVIFVDDPKIAFVHEIGAELTDNEIFPDRANIEFVSVINRVNLSMRVYERGAGETLACGTGACAALVAAVQNDLCDREVNIKLLGGNLHIEWCKADNHVYMTGPAEFVCSGQWPMPSNKLIPEFSIDEAINANSALSS